MAAGACQSAAAPHKVTPTAKVPLPQGKLDEFPHLDREDWFRGRRHAQSFMPSPGTGNRKHASPGRRHDHVGQAFQSAGEGDFPVARKPPRGLKAPPTARLESPSNMLPVLRRTTIGQGPNPSALPRLVPS
jgi:hypothetical protein